MSWIRDPQKGASFNIGSAKLPNFSLNHRNIKIPEHSTALHNHKANKMVCRSIIDGSVCTPNDMTVGNNCSNAKRPGELISAGLFSCEYAHCASDMVDCKLEKLPQKAQQEIMTARRFLAQNKN